MAHDPHYARNSISDIAPKLAEPTTHRASYAGWPCAFSAVGVLRQVSAERAP